MKKKPLREEEEEQQESAEEIAAVENEPPTDVTAPEVNPKTKEVTEWNDAPADHGTAAPKVGPAAEDDENSIAAKLVYEGTDEADRERRLAASDPDYEP